MTATDLADATPTAGILWVYRFRPGGIAELVPNEQTDAALAAHGEGWLWVHLALADMRCRTWIAQHAPISDFARETLTGPDQHLRLDVLGSEIVGVLPDLHQEFTRTSDSLVRLRFVMTERMMITARSRPVHSVEITKRTIEAGKRSPSVVSFLDAVIDQFADAVGRMADRLGDELDQVEDHVMHEEPADERHRIGRVRLKAVRVHRQLAQLRSLFHRVEPRIAADNAAVGGTIAGWRRSSTASTPRSPRCTSARGCCSTRSPPR
jgi:zinc transporter